MSEAANRRAQQNQERARASQTRASSTNSDVRPGATTTGRAGSQEAAENKEQSENINPNQTIKINIQRPKNQSTSLRYPSDPAAIEADSDYVLFSFYRYAPPFGGGKNTPNRAESNNTSKAATNPWGYSNYSDSSDRSYANPSTDLSSVILYMPEDIQTQFGAGWNGAGFGAVAAGMATLAGSINTQKDFGAILQAAPGATFGGIKSATFSALLAGINAVAGANINLNQLTGTTTGTILNPNVELAYEAPKLRNFSLKFKLVPRTGKEAKDIQKICNTFKKAMLPKFGGQAIFGAAEASNLITIPDLCQVIFMKGSDFHPFLPKYKLCGITDVSINYTAAGAYATMGDGSPVATELTISFLESKLIFAGEVDIDGGGI
jgi:hypothetical protein